MKLRTDKPFHTGDWLGLCVIWMTFGWVALGGTANAQQLMTTTVQGTVYSASGEPCAGSLQVSWPAFTTAANQAIAAGRKTVTIGLDGFVSVNLAPNQGASPAGLYYTAIYHLSNGATSTEYWVVPAAAQTSIGQVRAQIMPSAQAVQTVSKKYVDQSIQELTQSLLTASGGSLSGPLYLNGDPEVPTQAASKHYVDSAFGQALPISGGTVTGPLTSVKLGAVYQADQFPGVDFGARLDACIQGLDTRYGGTCDARNFTGTQAMGSDLRIVTANVTVELPCATIATAHQIIVTAGTRNVTLHGCGLRGASAASGSEGGTVFLYSGAGAMVQVGDQTYSINTPGFHLDNSVINTTASNAATAQGLAAFRTQELDLEGLYLLGNSNQTGMTLDGTGNYSGGTFQDIELGGFSTAIKAIGHRVANGATTDWMNASTFVRLHINCPTSGGSPIGGTYGIDLQQGDGNTFTGGDVEGCSTAVHLGLNAQNNTIVGLRNENSTYQVVADSGSSYNSWMTGGTMFTGKLADSGTRNSFLDTFHRSFNGMNGDWYGSQQDATLMNHYRLGIGTGAERGLQDRYQTDYGYRWTTGLSDATAGEQFYQVLDELNSVYRLSIGQYNNGQSSTNNQTVINAAGTGAVVLNGSRNAGTGGVVFGAGGADGATVATINSVGNAQFNGTLQVGGASTFTTSTTIKNQADSEIDAFLWAGATKSQKESFIYKDWNGSSQWYLVKDASNNWALNSAIGGLDSIKAYQSTNSGDTYINASNPTGHVRLNYEAGSGAETDIYSGSSSGLVAAFLNPNAIKFPGLAASSGRNCLQIDNSGYISNTGSGCSTGGGQGTVSTGMAGQIAYYAGDGTSIAGTNLISIAAGGTGASTAAEALQSLGGQASLPGVTSDGAAGVKVNGNVTAGTTVSAQSFNGAPNLLTTSPPCAAGNYWLAPIAGSLNGWQQCSNGVLAPIGSGGSGLTVSVTDFGAKADTNYNVNATTCNTSSGSATLSCDSATNFVSGDVGKYLQLQNFSTNPFSTTPAVAKIVAVTGAHTVTMDKTAIATVSTKMNYGTDNAPAFNAALQAVYAKGGGTVTVPTSVYQYGLFTTPYYVHLGASDDGSSLMPAGGSGAVATATLTNGVITGYTLVSGGSGYTKNSTLQVTVGANGCAGAPGPCGEAQIWATTNSAGAVTSLSILEGGFGFSAVPTLTINPISGDGATATATISSGSLSSVNVTTGGSGYVPNSYVQWIAVGGGCTPLTGAQGANTSLTGSVTGTTIGGPSISAYGTLPTDSSGQVAGSPAITQAGAGCTSAPSILFGNAGCGGPPWTAQCTNLAPIRQAALPTAVYLLPHVSIQGTDPNSPPNITTAFDQVNVDNNEQVAFAASNWQYGGIYNLHVNAFIGIYTGYMANSTIAYYSHWGGIGLLTTYVDLGSSFHDLYFQGAATWVNGGRWAWRADYPSEGGGYFDAYQVYNIIARPSDYNAYPVNAKYDDWFANNFWHPEFSGLSNDFWETCKYPQTTNQRMMSRSVTGDPHSANQACYNGIAGNGLTILTRYNRATGSVSINNLTVKGAQRYMFNGDLGGASINTASCEGCTQIASDPYRAALNREGMMKYTNGAFVNTAGTDGPSTQCLWGVNQSGNGAPAGGWANLNCRATANPGSMASGQFYDPKTYTVNAISAKVYASTLYVGSSPGITSTSSATGTQLVTCPPGGSSTQYCGADGAWHNSTVYVPPSVVGCGFLSGCVESLFGSANAGWTGVGSLGAASGASGGVNSASSTAPMMLQSTSAATQGLSAGWYSYNTLMPYWGARYPTISFTVGYNAWTDYNNSLVNLGLLNFTCNAATFTASNNPACNYAVIQYSAARGDAGYKCVTGNGSAQTITDIGVGPTIAFTSMSVSFGASGITCTVNGTSVTNTTNLPNYAQAFGDVFLDTTLAASQVRFRMSSVYGYSQNGNF